MLKQISCMICAVECGKLFVLRVKMCVTLAYAEAQATNGITPAKMSVAHVKQVYSTEQATNV